MELTSEHLERHTIVTDRIDPRKLDFINEYIRQQSILVQPVFKSPERHPVRKTKRKRVVDSMRKRDDRSKSPLSPVNRHPQPKKVVKRLTIKNNSGIFNKGVRSNVALASMAFDEDAFFTTKQPPVPKAKKLVTSAYFEKEKNKEPSLDEEDVFVEKRYPTETREMKHSTYFEKKSSTVDKDEDEEPIDVFRVVKKSRVESRPLTPRNVEQLTPRATSPIEFLSSPKLMTPIVEKIRESARIVETPAVERKIREAVSNVEEIDEDFWAGLCQGDNESNVRAPIEEDCMIDDECRHMRGDFTVEEDCRLGSDDLHRPKTRRGCDDLREGDYRPRGGGLYRPRTRRGSNDRLPNLHGRQAFVDYSHNGSVVGDSLDDCDEGAVDDSILGYEDVIGAGNDSHDVANVFRYRAHRLYSDSDCV